MENVLYNQRFVTGCRTFNGKYNLFAPCYRGLLNIRITSRRISVTVLGFKVWEAPLSNISSIKIQPQVLGGIFKVTAHDGKGFLFIINDAKQLVDIFKGLNLPLQYDEKALESETQRHKFASNPIVLTLGILLGVAFVVFIIYNILCYPQFRHVLN